MNEQDYALMGAPFAELYDPRATMNHRHKFIDILVIAVVSAWASNNRLVLGQRQVDAKANKITAVSDLLESLMLKGCIVTLDALNCQPKLPRRLSSRRPTTYWRSKAIKERSRRM